MKKLLLSVAILVGASSGVNAQLQDGSVAPNFTFTDINGTDHTLYDYLDAGQTVVLDLFAVWCSPCWSYAQSGVMDDVWNTYGPSGTNEIIVMSVEADPSTAASTILGGGNSIGDWSTVVGNLLGDSPTIAADYELAYYPTIFMICPNRIVKEVGQLTSAAAFYSEMGNCQVANGTNNGALLQYTGETVSCGGAVDIVVDLQNMGTGNLTSATIEVFDGATSVASTNWTGNLATYGIESVNVGSVTPVGTVNYSIEITSTDDNASDNTLAQTISEAAPTDIMVTVDLLTDTYADEIWMEITNSSGTIVWSEGNENVQGNYDTGQFPPAADPTNPLVNETSYSWDVNLPAVDCYTFTIYDYYGDGLQEGNGGSWDVLDNTGSIILSETAVNYGGMDQGNVKNQSVGLDELAVENVTIYPNPATDLLNVSFTANDADYTVSVMDLQGRTVATQVISGSGTQSVAFPVADVASGSYIVTIASEAGSHTDKVVIK